MSAIAGVFIRDGSPAEHARLDRVDDSLRSAGPCRECRSSDASIAMIARRFEPRGKTPSRTPWILQDDGWLLSFNGRLDNARDLRAMVSADRSGASLSAPHLALAAYRHFGVMAFARMIGDFALALWDPRARRVILATDSLGRQPLYYHCSPRLVFWASTSRAVRAALDGNVRVNDTHVAEFLTNSRITTSPFSQIELVPGGHVFVADATTAGLRRYWSLDHVQEIRYRTDAEYEEHFRSVFDDAVSCRLDTESPVFCELSGGLDSSSIACVAQRHIDVGERATRFRTVSYVFDEAAHDDERPYISVVESALGQPGIHISETACPLLTPIAPGLLPDTPTNAICFVSRFDRLFTLMQGAGARVLLSGVGGDQLFWSQPEVGLLLADLVAGREVRKLLTAAASWSRVLKRPALALLGAAVTPLLPLRWHPQRQLATWLHPEFVRRLDLRARVRCVTTHPSFQRPSGAAHHARIWDTMRPSALELCLSEGHIDRRYPFLDRRLAEFALAIPLDQHIRLGESRSIVRRSLRGIVPHAILERRTKAGPDEAILRAMVREGRMLSALTSDPRCAALGFVDRTRLQDAVKRARHGQSVNTSQLLRTISVELWLRTLEEGPAFTTGVSAPPAGEAIQTGPALPLADAPC